MQANTATTWGSLSVAGSALLGGALALDLGYTPASGDSFTVLSAFSGVFALLSDTPAGFNTAQGPVAVTVTKQ